MKNERKELIIKEILKAVKDNIDNGRFDDLVSTVRRYSGYESSPDMIYLAENYGNNVADCVSELNYKFAIDKAMRHYIWFIANDIFKKHSLNDNEINNIRGSVSAALTKNKLDAISVYKKLNSRGIKLC